MGWVNDLLVEYKDNGFSKTASEHSRKQYLRATEHYLWYVNEKHGCEKFIYDDVTDFAIELIVARDINAVTTLKNYFKYLKKLYKYLKNNAYDVEHYRFIVNENRSVETLVKNYDLKIRSGRKRLKEAELLQIIDAAIKEVSRTPTISINKHTLAALYVILNVYLPWKRNEVCFLKINQENIREKYIEKDGRQFKLPSVIWELLRKRTLVTCEDSYIFNYVAGESVVFEKFGERMNELLYDFIYESDEINMKLIGVDVFPTEAIKHTVLYILANDSNFEFTPPKLSAISGLSHSYVSVYYDFEREYNVTDFFEIWNKHF